VKASTGFCLAENATSSNRPSCLDEPSQSCGTPPARFRSLMSAQRPVSRPPLSGQWQPRVAIHTSARALPQSLFSSGAAPASIRQMMRKKSASGPGSMTQPVPRSPKQLTVMYRRRIVRARRVACCQYEPESNQEAECTSRCKCILEATRIIRCRLRGHKTSTNPHHRVLFGHRHVAAGAIKTAALPTLTPQPGRLPYQYGGGVTGSGIGGSGKVGPKTTSRLLSVCGQYTNIPSQLSGLSTKHGRIQQA